MTLERDIITAVLIILALIIVAYLANAYPGTRYSAWQTYQPVASYYNQPANVLQPFNTTYQYQQTVPVTTQQQTYYSYTQPGQTTTYTTGEGTTVVQ